MARASKSATSPRKRLYREGSPGERWWFALFLLPTLLTAFIVFTRGGEIEDQLERDSLAGLEAAGLSGVRVEMSGRNALVLVPTGQNEAKAVEVVLAVRGIADVDSEGIARTAAEARACDDLQSKVDHTTGSGISFTGASQSLSGQAAGVAAAVARLLVKCPSASVVVDGHTDGTVLNGSTISLRRAEAVRNALVRGGVNPGRIQPNGYGASLPASNVDTPAGRALNNRVTITVGEE